MEGHLTHVEQCPRCELRFRHEHELRDHLSSDHDETAAELADDLEHSRADRAERARAQRKRMHRTFPS